LDNYFCDEKIFAQKQIEQWEQIEIVIHTLPAYNTSLGAVQIWQWQGYLAGIESVYEYFEQFVGKDYLDNVRKRYGDNHE
jgi:hypothetical protein